MNSKFNADLLRVARQVRGWSQTELSNRSSVSQAHLSKVENGLLAPTDEVTKKFAETLNFPVDFFEQQDRVMGLPVSVHPMYRKRASVGQRAIDALEAELNIRIMSVRRLLKSATIEAEFPMPSLDIDEFDGDIEEIAALVRRTWLLPSGPIKNLVEVAERAGCIVMHCDFSSAGVDGVTVKMAGLPPCIFLNKNAPADRQRFSLAHEIGHIVMHPVPSQTMEDEANAFASALLMPMKDIKRPLSGRLTLQRLASLKPVWRTSMAALLYRAKAVGAITPNQSQYLWRQLSKMGYRKNEPAELDFAVEEPVLVPELFRLHLEELGYSLSELASALCLAEKDIVEFYHLDEGERRPHLTIVK
jgi:Zn-dependent peptidase ImmA (M78 family)/transcriptional regulator with XRE-family HTH domain